MNTTGLCNAVYAILSVIRLTWHRLLRWSADVCTELCNSFRCRFCKVPPQLCDGSTLIRDMICSSRSRLHKGRDISPHSRMLTLLLLLYVEHISRDQPNSREKMRDFTVEFLKCAKFHGKFTEGV